LLPAGPASGEPRLIVELVGVLAGPLGGLFRRVRAGVRGVVRAQHFPFQAVRFLFPRRGLLASGAETTGSPLLRYRLAHLSVPLGGLLCQFSLVVCLHLDGPGRGGGRLPFAGRGPVLAGQIPPGFLQLCPRGSVAGTRLPARGHRLPLQLRVRAPPVPLSETAGKDAFGSLQAGLDATGPGGQPQMAVRGARS
jgi:hypothetical protein